MPPIPSPLVHIDDVEETTHFSGGGWGQAYKPLTPALDALPGRLGANLTRVPPGHSGCPFHSHMVEDEVFYILSGTGVLRYGEALFDLRAGHCIACPAGTGVAHQIANTGEVDLVYLAVGPNLPHEVGVYPDTGKVMVRGLKFVGRLTPTDYMDGEPEVPRIFELARDLATRGGADQ